MFALIARRGRLKPSALEHSYLLLYPKRRRLSSLNPSQSLRDSASALSPLYFFSNLRCENAYSNPLARSQREGVSPEVLRDTLGIAKTFSEGSSNQRDLSYFKVKPPLTIPRLLTVYGQLSKSNLTFLIVLTAMSGVALSPLSATVPVLFSTAIGTALCSASANTLNQLAEVPFDAQMARTRMRPLVRGAISSSHAVGFAVATGISGPAVLWIFANPVSALLGIANIGLYAGVYTRLKRVSVANTWVGAVVGGIPPLIGWTACGGKLLPSSTYPIEFFPPPFLSDLTAAIPIEHVDNPLSALALFCLLFSWQFPHFNSLAHTVRSSYAQAGYKMLPVTNPSLNALVSLRHAAGLVGICSVLIPLSGLTTWAFALTSLAPNAFMSRGAWRFWRAGTEKEARQLFYISLWYLPVVLALMMFHKQGMEWSGLFRWTDSRASDAEIKPGMVEK